MFYTVILVLFGAELTKALREEPMMYQGASDAFLGPRDDIAVEREDWEIDLEGELAVVVGDVPMGVKREKAGEHIRLVIRNLLRSVHGEFDRAGFSHPGRLGWCIAEDVESLLGPARAGAHSSRSRTT